MLLLDALVTGLWGGLLALDRRAFLQAMLSRPLAAATTTGLLLGDITSGLYVGLVFELFYLGAASFGSAHPDHETLPAVTAAAMAASLGHATHVELGPAAWSLGILLFAPMGIVGRRIENRLDERARKYAGRARTAADLGQLRRVGRQNLRAIWPHFVFYGLASAAAAFVGYLLGPLMAHLSPAVVQGLAWVYPAVSMAAAGLAVFGSGATGRLTIGALSALLVGAITAGSAYWRAR